MRSSFDKPGWLAIAQRLRSIVLAALSGNNQHQVLYSQCCTRTWAGRDMSALRESHLRGRLECLACLASGSWLPWSVRLSCDACAYLHSELLSAPHYNNIFMYACFESCRNNGRTESAEVQSSSFVMHLQSGSLRRMTVGINRVCALEKLASNLCDGFRKSHSCAVVS
jgi:hypothetical protein